MGRISRLMILAFAATISLPCQDDRLRRLETEIIRRNLEEGSDVNEAKMARYRIMVLNHKMNQFSTLYNKLAQLHIDGGWDSVLARKVDEAFNDMKKCEGWDAKANARRH